MFGENFKKLESERSELLDGKVLKRGFEPK